MPQPDDVPQPDVPQADDVELQPPTAETPSTETTLTAAVLPPATQAAPPPEATPAPDVAPLAAPPPRARKRDRVFGTIGQVVGVVGLVACLVLALGVVLARGWAVGTVDDVAAAAVVQVAKVEPLLGQASAKVGEISGRVSTVADIAAGIATAPNPVPGLTDGLRTGLAGVSERYETLRSNYTAVREALVSVGDRLETLDRLVPAISIPQGPTDALAALDARLGEFDANVSGLLTIDPGQGPIRTAAAAVAEKAAEVDARIDEIQAKIGDVQDRVSALGGRISDAAGTIKTVITIGAIGTILLLLYFALLHWVLFRHSGEIRRKRPAG